jgi:hypothetical protein
MNSINIECSACGRMVPKNEMTWEHVRPRFLEPDRRGGRFKVCVQCNMRAAGEQLKEYEALAVSRNKEPYQTFLLAMYEIEALLGGRPADDKQRQYLSRILFASVITAMETYLADTFINRVLNAGELIKKLVETDPVLKDRKVNLASIAAGYDLHREVSNYLVSEVMFHNVAKSRRCTNLYCR